MLEVSTTVPNVHASKLARRTNFQSASSSAHASPNPIINILLFLSGYY